MSLDKTIVASVRRSYNDLNDLEERLLDIVVSTGARRGAKTVCTGNKNATHRFFVSNTKRNVALGMCVDCEELRYFVNKSIWGRADKVSLAYIKALLQARVWNEEMEVENLDDYNVDTYDC